MERSMYMKKALRILLPLCILMGIRSITFQQAHPQPQISDYLNADISQGVLVESVDTRTFLRSIGATMETYAFADDRFLLQISDNPSWYALPLSAPLAAAAYGSQEGQTTIGPYLTDAAGDPLLPPVENGYFYFLDRHTQSKNNKDPALILDRYYMHFILALYDADAKMLYYCTLET